MAVLVADVSPQQKYIDKYGAIAVDEMYRSGVPASITLAQGLLESRYGLSELAAKGNNHFGIKCHNDWKGKSMKVDDDRRGECFRVYSSAVQSFQDHSDFLRYRDRYKALFELEITDYKGWAYGLSKAGYATDPAYPQKLIRLIEDYGLYRFDQEGLEDEALPQRHSSPQGTGPALGDGKPVEQASSSRGSGRERSSSAGRQSKSKENAATKGGRSRGSRSAKRVIPEPPSELESPQIVPASRADEVFHFSLDRKLYTQNGVPFVYSQAGETYASIAGDYNLFLKEILKFNDLEAEGPLPVGTPVYVRSKKNRAARGVDKYVVGSDGEQLRDICQRFGVKLSSVLKRNGFASQQSLREGDTIVLR